MPVRLSNKTEGLRKQVKGKVMLPGEAGYDEARRIWNAMIDRQPAVIVQCVDAGDVAPAVSFARDNGLDISVRGGGHNIAGYAVCDGGLMIDFSRMRGVRVDPNARRAFVEP